MKKQIILVSIFIFLTGLMYSQENLVVGKITYTATLNIRNFGNFIANKPQEYKKYEKQINKLLDNNSDLDYFLKFNHTTSSFLKKKVMEPDGNKSGLNFTEIKVGKGIFYTSIKDKLILHQKESFGNQFLITIPKIKWTLTNEEKKIGDYVCLKAKAIKKIEGRSGTKNISVTAWYSTQIPFNFGPKEYSGLPGLILELKEGDLTFIAAKIELNVLDKISIKKPSKGKKLSLNEFNEMIKEMLGDRKKMN